MTQFISLVASSSASTADADADAPADNTRRVVHHLAHLTVLQITNVTESIPSYLLAVIMVLAVVLIFLLCWCALAPLSRFILPGNLHKRCAHCWRGAATIPLCGPCTRPDYCTCRVSMAQTQSPILTALSLSSRVSCAGVASTACASSAPSAGPSTRPRRGNAARGSHESCHNAPA